LRDAPKGGIPRFCPWMVLLRRLGLGLSRFMAVGRKVAMSNAIRKVVVVGGSNSAHVLIPLLAERGYEVSLLTRHPEKWSKRVRVDYLDSSERLVRSAQGELKSVSSDYGKTLEGADLVILCLPVHVYRETLSKIGAAISPSRNLIIGTIYGQAGFNWMVEEMKRDFLLPHVSYFAFGLIPFICRTKEYGSLGLSYGTKELNLAAFSDDYVYEALSQGFLDDCCFSFFGKGRFRRVPNFISLTMSVDNQLIHPSRLWDLFELCGGKWKNKDGIPYFYRDFTVSASKKMEILDDDLDRIRVAIKKRYPSVDYTYMMNYMDLERYVYRKTFGNIYDSFIESSILGNIKTPVIEVGGEYRLDKNGRFFTDDIFYGLCVMKSIADALSVSTPSLDKILSLASETIGKAILRPDGHLEEGLDCGAVSKYGFPLEWMLTD
jgi:hypothetical protein